MHVPECRALRLAVACVAIAALFNRAAPPSRTAHASARATVRSVTLRTQDGISLAASFFEPSRRLAPAVICIHMLTRTREDWQSVAARLSDAGFGVLTFDLRGHGGSRGSADDLTAMVQDVRAAVAFLAGRSDVQSGAVGLAGASVGANLAVLMAADELPVRSIALFSPGLDYRGLRIDTAMKKYGDRPALLVAGRNDPYAIRSVKQLAALGTGTRDVHIVEGGGHGTALFASAPDLIGVVVDWFQRTLL